MPVAAGITNRIHCPSVLSCMFSLWEHCSGFIFLYCALLNSHADIHSAFKRISSPSSLAHTLSPKSSISGFKGAVSRYEPASPSPTPSQINANLAQFPPSSANSEAIHYQIIEDTAPPLDQINGTIALYKAILQYHQSHPELSEFMEACTGDLMISITAMSNANVAKPLPITNREYNHIAHLTYVSAFMDKIAPYLNDAI